MKYAALLTSLVMFVSAPIAAQDLTTYSKPPFSITYPSNWIFDDSGNAGSIFMISSPLMDEEDTYQDCLTLNKYLLAPGQNLDNYAEQLVKDIPFFYQESKIEANQRREKDGHAFQVIEYSGLYNNFGLTFRQMLWVDDQYIYDLRFTGNTGSVDKVMAQAILMMNSFSFTTK
ncbi:MAG: PsbP-related protein [Flavobacteriales bacterium]